MPVYQENAALRGVFSYRTDDDPFGFVMGQQLAERLGDSQSARFVLKTTARTDERAAAITAEGDTSRLNITGEANWSITEVASSTQLATGKVSAFTSYSATASTVATQASRDDATARLAMILADMIVTRVLAQADRLTQ